MTSSGKYSLQGSLALIAAFLLTPSSRHCRSVAGGVLGPPISSKSFFRPHQKVTSRASRAPKFCCPMGRPPTTLASFPSRTVRHEPSSLPLRALHSHHSLWLQVLTHWSSGTHFLPDQPHSYLQSSLATFLRSSLPGWMAEP